MILDVGNVLRLEDPKSDQVRHHLRNLPLEAPFLILWDGGGGERFIQTRPYSGGYRVEWRDSAAVRRHALVNLERAEELLCAYLRRDETVLRDGAAWHTLKWYNDPYCGLVAAGVVLGAILTILLAAEFWHMVR